MAQWQYLDFRAAHKSVKSLILALSRRSLRGSFEKPSEIKSPVFVGSFVPVPGLELSLDVELRLKMQHKG